MTGQEARPGESGVAMIEATIGICLLLFATLGAIQIMLVFHGALAAHSAATRTARAQALTGQRSEAQRVYESQRATSLGALQWDPAPNCVAVDDGAECTVHVRVPAILPGGGFLFGKGENRSLLAIEITEKGFYPNFERAN